MKPSLALVGAWTFAAAGVAWTIAAVATNAKVEVWNCGMIAVGTLIAAASLTWGSRYGVAGGWGLAAVAPYLVYGFSLPNFADPLAVVGFVALAVAVIAALIPSSLGVRIGMALVAIGSVSFLESDLRGYRVWTIGNVLFVLGPVLIALGRPEFEQKRTTPRADVAS